MRWSWNLGRIAGIEIRVHVTFLLVLLWAAIEQWMETHSAWAVAAGVVFLLLLFGCVVLHELGHAMTARHFGIATRDITLLPIGGVARLERMPRNPTQELLVALAGPAVNLVIAGALFGVLQFFKAADVSDNFPLTPASFVATLMAINLILIAFNLIPAFPMDGGRVLRSLLARWLSYRKATWVAARLGQAIAVGFMIVGVFGIGRMHPNPFLVLIGFFVWIGARQEANMVALNNALEGVPVSQVMMTQFQTLSPDDDLKHAAELILAGGQQDFPVVQEGRVAGMLNRGQIMEALQREGERVPVRQVMSRQFPVVDAGELLEPLLAKLQEPEIRALPVVEFGRLVGLLTWENLREFVMIHSAMHPAA